MTSSLDELIAAVSVLVKMGYKVTLEAPPVGKAGNGVYLHVVDEGKEKN